MARSSDQKAFLFYYYCLKFSLSVYSTLFSIIGLVILGIGIYAEAERQMHKTLEGIFLAPAIILLLLGIGMFAVSFIGMVGSLRDNRTLLKMFFWILLAIFIIQLLLIFIEFFFENKMKELIHANLQEGIKHYYDDLDFKNILDFVQKKFYCCGGDDYSDWEVNLYHACNSTGPLACGVPYTCCKVKERLELIDIIYVRGCIHAISLWFKDNFEATLGIVFAFLSPQVVGLFLSWFYWTKLDDILSQSDTVDFRLLQIRDFRFKELDLRGAGWCLCLPREGGYIPVNTDEDGDTYNMGDNNLEPQCKV
uniref:Tetraspanin-15 n=1 Tax=Geotrypetes seraphini TaxID=260995 RepID=A0A6P8R7D9_GEOSA|nr:tetraspanin-15-like isoform X2 [Geotrypetes seraphini]